MYKKGIHFIIFLLFCSVSAGCVQYVARYDGPYEGKVVDADTGSPIGGVVVLGVWYKEQPTVAGAVSSYYDAEETVTDREGNFKITGKGLKILSNVGVMNYLIFKTGYEYIGLWTWESLKDGEIHERKVRWVGNKPIIPLKKLTMEERKKQGSPDFSSQIPGERMKLMLREVNIDRVERGLDPYSLGGSR